MLIQGNNNREFRQEVGNSWYWTLPETDPFKKELTAKLNKLQSTGDEYINTLYNAVPVEYVNKAMSLQAANPGGVDNSVLRRYLGGASWEDITRAFPGVSFIDPSTQKKEYFGTYDERHPDTDPNLAARAKAISEAQDNPQPVNAAPLPTTGGAQPIDTNYFMKPGESFAAYNARIAAYNASKPKPQTIDTNYFMKPGEAPDAYTKRVAAYNAEKNKPVSSIGNPVPTPTTNGSPPAPSLPKPTAAASVDQYFTGITAQLDGQKKAYQQEADRRAQDYQRQIDQLTAQEKDAQKNVDKAVGNLGEEVRRETAEKRAELDEQKRRFEENYNANQALTNELDGLLTQGNQIVEQLRNTTGLASILNPRISKTMTDVTARAGVIQAVLAARNDQIGLARQQLASSLDAIGSIYGDQISYYKTLADYYLGQKDESGKKIASLSKEKQAYLDTRLQMLEQDLATAQKTSDMISKAMLDPDTALAFGRSGVSLTDSPAQINQKLATYAYTQEVTNIANTMAEKGYSTTPIAGVTPVVITDSNGVSKSYYKKGGDEDGSFTLGTNQIRFDSNGNVIASGPRGASGGTGSTPTERTQALDNQAAIDLYGSIAEDAMAQGATPEEAVAAAAAIAAAGGGKLDLQNQKALLDHLKKPASTGINWNSYQAVNNLSGFLFSK